MMMTTLVAVVVRILMRTLMKTLTWCLVMTQEYPYGIDDLVGIVTPTKGGP